MKKVEVQCLLALRDGGPMTIAQLATATGLSRPTVDGSLTSLTEAGLALVADDTVGGGRDAGRPAKVFSFDPSAGLIVGVDVGGHAVRVVVADMAGAIRIVDEAALRPELAGGDALETIYALLDRVLADPRAIGPLRGIGIGVAGIVGPDGRVSLSYALPAWNAADIAGRLEQRYSCPVALENDARLASMAEHHLGASALAENVIYLNVGHRLSVSLLVGGRPHRGRHSASGEAGYLLFRDVPTDEFSNIVWTTAGSAEEVVSRSLKGDADATAELMRFIAALAPGIAALALTVDPDLVVVGGGLSRAGTLVIPALQAAVNAQIRVPAMPTLVQSRLGSEAVVVGSMIRGFELASRQLYGDELAPPPGIRIDDLIVPPLVRSAEAAPAPGEPART